MECNDCRHRRSDRGCAGHYLRLRAPDLSSLSDTHHCGVCDNAEVEGRPRESPLPLLRLLGIGLHHFGHYATRERAITTSSLR